MLLDAHQHLWTPPLIEALARRRALPLLRREDGEWTLHLAAEPACAITADDRQARTALLDEDEVDAAVVALSAPLGIEGLDPDAARTLIEAHTRGVRAYGPRFRRWASVPLFDPDPLDVDHELHRGAIGLTLPAGALTNADDLTRLSPLLERLEARGAPLFVHPGPDPWAASIPPDPRGPAWWPALTTYVAQMQTAWLTLVTEGKQLHPRLRILFALAAGGAPLHAERLVARGGPSVDPADPRLFYDTSSHGPRAVAALRSLDVQLVHGSDRPLTGPGTPARMPHAAENAALLFGSFLPSTLAVPE
jgi:6-methylsalicylate decarboxylase